MLEGLGQVLHVPVLAASTATAGLLLLRGWSRTGGRSSGLGATSSAGWLQRLERLQQQFEQLDPDGAASSRRCVELEQLRAQLERPGLHLGLVGACPEEPSWRAQVAASLRGPAALSLHWSRPLPPATQQWSWPEPFASCDILLYGLKPPLLAADLRWIQAVPAGQPLVLLVEVPSQESGAAVAAELRAQLPTAHPVELVCWHDVAALGSQLSGLGARWAGEAANLRSQRQQRCLAALHSRWQGQLEGLRRVGLPYRNQISESRYMYDFTRHTSSFGLRWEVVAAALVELLTTARWRAVEALGSEVWTAAMTQAVATRRWPVRSLRLGAGATAHGAALIEALGGVEELSMPLVGAAQLSAMLEAGTQLRTLRLDSYPSGAQEVLAALHSSPRAAQLERVAVGGWLWRSAEGMIIGGAQVEEWHDV